MELYDLDLASVQETRILLKNAYEAQKKLSTFNQSEIDKIVKAISEAGIKNAEKLAKMANEETGFGIYEDKILKNLFAAKTVYEAIKDQKTVGIIAQDKEHKTIDIGIGVGVVAGIVPSTNPTSTVIYKTMISLKGGNAIVFSPHPSAKNCTLEAVKIVREAAENAGCPKGAIGVISTPTLQATQELMKNDYTSLILATGGGAMVKAAYSSGTPAIGVGAGNGPAYIDKSADIPKAIMRIFASKTFDNGTICASEQSIVIEKSIESIVKEEIKKQNGYILNDGESRQLAKFILRANGTMNPAIVGKSVKAICELADLKNVPDKARVLIANASAVGSKVPYSKEKLAPILALYVENSVDDAMKRCKEILDFEGAGHTFAIHADDDELVKKFALQMPASRILVNTSSALGGIGATTNLFPALTLGCGAVGGSSSSNNIGPIDVINIKRVAYGIKELSDIRSESSSSSCCKGEISEELVDLLVSKIIKELI